MKLKNGIKIKEQFLVWRIGLLPGLVIIALVIIARFSGLMQSLEWLAFDNFLRWRFSEAIDEKILIVEINEEDIRSVGKYPIPDKNIAELIRILQNYNPRVIGLDIYRDLPVEPGNKELRKTFAETKNLILIEKVLPEKVSPPPGLSPQQVCFADQITDSDGKLRRSLLATPTPEQEYKFSLSICLAQAYLAALNLELENGIRDKNAMRFADIEIPRFTSNSGGYIRADDGGVQILLNHRSGQKPFRTVNFNQVISGKFNSEWIRNRIIIIGITAPSIKDFITTAAIKSSEPAQGRVYGVEIQAHAVSQIINGVLEGRAFINTWSDEWEYIFILILGILGIYFARLSKSPLKNFIAIGIATFTLISISYLCLLVEGLWIPLIPSTLVFTLNGLVLTALYQYDEALRSKIKSRQILIERTFETIHNGPLQTLAKSLKKVRDNNIPPQDLLGELELQLEQLNYELRGIYEYLQQEQISQDRSLYLGNSFIIDLQDPIHEILYQIYNYTLERDFPCFKSLRIKVRTFEPIDDQELTIEQKRAVCRFLEEALINVGKHATGLTRLEVTCTKNEGWYILSIVDDGLGINSSRVGRGTQQFRNIARQLRGKFRRSSLSPKGTLCELCWTKRKFYLWK